MSQFGSRYNQAGLGDNEYETGENRAGGSGSGWGNRYRSNRSNNGAQPNPTYEGSPRIIKVPTNKVGRIIGRGGMTIKQIQRTTLTKIKIVKSETDQSDVILFGEKEALSAAEKIILRYVDEGKSTKEEPESLETTAVQCTTQQKTTEDYSCFVNWISLGELWYKERKDMSYKLPKIVKDILNEHIMSTDEVDKWRKNNALKVKRLSKVPEPIPNPALTFEHAFHNHSDILKKIYTQGYKKPLPIQSQVWPILLSGEDMISITPPGTDNSLTYILPAIIHINGHAIPRKERKGPCALLMAPTNDLIQEIEKEIEQYLDNQNIHVYSYSGSDQNDSIHMFEVGVDIVIATSDHINDLILTGYLNLQECSFIVLYEADKIVDFEHEFQIYNFFHAVRPDCQIIMTSAIWPTRVQDLAHAYLKKPIQVNVGSPAAVHVDAVLQKNIVVDATQKEDLLIDFLLKVGPNDKTLVFCASKVTANSVCNALELKQINCAPFHRGLYPEDRKKALEDIENGTIHIIVATDEASKRLNVKDVNQVINFDFPKTLVEYADRLERLCNVQCAGRTGIVLSFITNDDWALAGGLITLLRDDYQEIPDGLTEMEKNYIAMKKLNKQKRRRGKVYRREKLEN